jgi:hypothetical protein
VSIFFHILDVPITHVTEDQEKENGTPRTPQVVDSDTCKTAINPINLKKSELEQCNALAFQITQGQLKIKDLELQLETKRAENIDKELQLAQARRQILEMERGGNGSIDPALVSLSRRVTFT